MVTNAGTTKMKTTQAVSKFVKIYEDFFQGLDPSAYEIGFWNTFFLLRVDVDYLENKIAQLSVEQVFSLKASERTFLSQIDQTK